MHVNQIFQRIRGVHYRKLTYLTVRERRENSTHSVWPWNTLTECNEGKRKSHKRNVVSDEDVTINFCIEWADACVISDSWPINSSYLTLHFAMS